jgi:hypothetical protein
MSLIPLGDTTWALRKALEVVIKRLLAVETVASSAATQSAYYKVGVGNPEGVVTANPGTTYVDITTAGSPVVYIKGSGTGNTGWV